MASFIVLKEAFKILDGKYRCQFTKN